MTTTTGWRRGLPATMGDAGAVLAGADMLFKGAAFEPLFDEAFSGLFFWVVFVGIGYV